MLGRGSLVLAGGRRLWLRGGLSCREVWRMEGCVQVGVGGVPGLRRWWRCSCLYPEAWGRCPVQSSWGSLKGVRKAMKGWNSPCRTLSRLSPGQKEKQLLDPRRVTWL